MKRFKQFINEDINDFLAPKSEKEIKSAIKDMNIMDKISLINKKELPEKYKPTIEEIRNSMDDVQQWYDRMKKSLDFEYRDFIGGIEQNEYDNIINKLIELKEKEKNLTITAKEKAMSEFISKMIDIINKDDNVNLDFNTSYHRRIRFIIDNMTRWFGSVKNGFEIFNKIKNK